MASSLVDNIIRLKSMLSDMEQDFGLTGLSISRKKCLSGRTRHQS